MTYYITIFGPLNSFSIAKHDVVLSSMKRLLLTADIHDYSVTNYTTLY